MKYLNDTVKINKNDCKMIAHRGFAGIEVENTLKAFNYAANSSAYGIECDVHVTKDGKFAVIHDDNFKRVADADVSVTQSTYDELLKISYLGKNDVADQNYKICLLSEFIDVCKRFNKRAIVEIKETVSYADAKLIAEEIIKLNYAENTTFISFKPESLDAVREVRCDFEVQFLTCGFDISIMPTLVTKKWDLDIFYQALTKERIDNLHELGIKVNAWTVDEKDVAELLVYWEIDFITSNVLE